MGRDESKHSSKHKRSHDVSGAHEHRRKKRHKDREDEGSSSKRKKEKRSKGETRIVDDDVIDDDMWVEKNVDLEGEIVSRLHAFQSSPSIHPSLLCSLWPRISPQQKA